MKIQIYGVNLTVEDGVAVAALGADHVGLDVWPGDAASLENARRVVERVRPLAATVVLPHSTDVVEILRSIELVGPDMAMTVPGVLEGDEDVVVRRLKELKRHLGDVLLMQGIAIGLPRVPGNLRALELALRYQEYVDIIILDTRIGDRIGVTGTPHDWEVSRQIVEQCFKPVILAGGLGPENVVEAMEKVRPWGVDACSALDLYPGKKDLAKVKEFIETIRRWEGEDTDIRR